MIVAFDRDAVNKTKVKTNRYIEVEWAIGVRYGNNEKEKESTNDMIKKNGKYEAYDIYPSVYI